jgi:autotransporter-associated beta strand protein
MALDLGNSTDNVILIDNSGAITISATVTGASRTLTLSGSGSGALTLSASNTYTGTTQLTSGILRAGNDGAFSSSLLLLNGGTLSSDSTTARSFANNVRLGGNVTFGDGVGTGALSFGNLDLGGTDRTVTTVVSTTFAGAVTNGSLTKAGAATLSLNNSGNSFGTLTINAGTASIGANTAITGLAGAGGGLNLSAGTLTVTQASSGTYAGVLSGAGSLTKAGAGALTLSGNSSGYTGTATVSAGTLVANGNLGGSVSVANGGTLAGSGTVGSVTVTNGATLSPGTSPGVLTTGNLTWEGGGNYNWQLYDASLAAGTGYDSISSSGTLTINATSGNKFNVNLWTLSGTNPDTNGPAAGFNGFTSGTFTLGTFASISDFAADKFNIVTGSANGTGGFANAFAGTFSLAQSGGTLNLVYTAPVISAWDYTATGGTWSTAGNWNPATVPSGTAALTFTGAGGGTTTNDISLDKATGITFAAGAGGYTITGGPITVGASGITNDSGNTQAFSANVALVGPTSFTAAAGGLTFSGTVDTAGNALTVTGSSNTTLGRVDGAGSFTKTGSGTATLTGAVASPNVTVSAGAVLMNGANLLADSGTVTVSGGTLNLQGHSDTIARLVVSSGSVAGSGGTLTAATYALSGGGVAANLGGGSLTVAGNATLGGSAAVTGVSLDSGTLTLGSGGRFTGAPAVTGSAGAGLVLGGNESLGSLAGAANVALGSATLTVGSANTSTTHSGVISGGGSLVKVGVGTTTLSGNNTYSGATTINAGAIATTAANAVSPNVTIGSDGTLTLGAAQTFTSLTGNGTLAAGNSAMTFDIAGTNDFGGTLTGNAASTLTKTGAGTMNFAGSTSGYLGSVTVNQGVITGLNSFGTGTVAMAGGSAYGQNGGTITNAFSIATPSVTSGSFSGYWNFGTASGNVSATTVTGAGVTFGDVSRGNSSAVTSPDNGSQSSGYTGASGSFNASAGARAGAYVSGSSTYFEFTVTGTGGYTFDVNSVTFGSRSTASGPSTLALVSTANLNNPLATAAAATNSNWSLQTLAETGTSATGAATYRIYGYNGSSQAPNWRIDDLTVSGSSFIPSSAPATATLGINEAGATTFSGPVAVTGTANLVAATGGTATFTGVISGAAGAIEKTGDGTVVLAGNNTYGGGVTVSAGTLQGTTDSLKGSIANDAAVVFSQATSGSYAGVMSGAGSLTKTGNGTVSLTAANTYTGTTSIAAGAIRVKDSGELQSSARIDVEAGASLVFARGDGYGGAYDGKLAGNGSVSVEQGTLNISGVNVFTGTTTVLNGAVLQLDGSLDNTAMWVDAGATLMGTGSSGGLTTIAGVHNPGSSPGIQYFDSLTYESTATVNWELWDNMASGPGVNYDQVLLTGSLSFDQSTTFNLVFNAGASQVDWTGGFWGFNQEWFIYNRVPTSLPTLTSDYLDGVNGAFLWDVRPDAAFRLFKGTRNSQTGVFLIYKVPEPSTYVLAGMGLAVIAWAARRRR